MLIKWAAGCPLCCVWSLPHCTCEHWLYTKMKVCVCVFLKFLCVIVFATLCDIVQMAVWLVQRCLWLTKVFPHSIVFVFLSLFSVCLFLTLCLSLHAPVCVAGCAGPGRDSSHPLITRYSTQPRGSLHCTLGPRNQNHTSLPNSRGAHNSSVGVFLPVCMLVSLYLCAIKIILPSLIVAKHTTHLPPLQSLGPLSTLNFVVVG